MPRKVLIDGSAADVSWITERGFQFGDGLFETIAISTGRPCLWASHMARLARGSRRLYLPAPDPELLRRECETLCAQTDSGVLKLYWTAGESARGYRRPRPLKPRRILQLTDRPPAPDRPWRARLCEHRIGDNPGLAGIKHLNRLDQVMARAEWDDPSIDEGLMRGQDGRVVCGTMSNLYLQSGPDLATPDLDRAGIAGVVRGLTLELGRQQGTPVAVRDLSLAEVRAADALYLSNALIGVVRVGALGDREYDLALPEHPLIGQARTRCLTPDGNGGVDG